MRVEPLHSGIERQEFAPALARMRHEPIEQPPAESVGAIGFACHEIVDIERLPGKEHLHDAKTGDRSDLAVSFEIGELESLPLLPLHLLHKCGGL